MDVFSAPWYDQIGKRHSRRRYTGMLPDDALLERLDEICVNFRPFLDQDGLPLARGVLLRDRDAVGAVDELFAGFIGNYGKIRGARCALAFVRNTRYDRSADLAQACFSSMALGYLGEGLILEATALGLGTCWVTGTYRPELAASLLDLDEYEDVAGLSPLGQTPDTPAIFEKLVSLAIGQMNRKPMASLAPGFENWPSWAQEAVAAARLAPSAANAQPWHFAWDQHCLTMTHPAVPTLERERKLRLDLGIARLHVNLSLSSHGYVAEWSHLDHGYQARVSRVQ